MTDKHQFSDSHLHAFVDNQLNENEHAEVLQAISDDPELSQKVNNIRQDIEMLRFAYNNCPAPDSRKPNRNTISRWNLIPLASAASLFLVIGLISGWLLFPSAPVSKVSPAFSSIEQFRLKNSTHRNIMIHVSNMNEPRLAQALDKAETILKNSHKLNKPVNLTVVANASGLGLLRKESPFGNRIKALSHRYANLKFKACGIAIESVRLKEGQIPKLLPEAIKVPNALREILNNLKTGWIYLKT